MSTPEPATLRLMAEDAARAGAAVLRRHHGAITGLRTKSAAHDLVSSADISAGVAIAQRIVATDPTARFVIEEPEVYELASVCCGSLDDDLVWVVDPLDGTTSFVHTYPCWSVSVACLASGRPVAGVVYHVPAEELYSAALGQGATCNGRRLVCAGAEGVESALIATGFPYDRGEPLDRQLRMLDRVLRVANGIRRDGSAAIDLCQVAANRCDAFWETYLRPWDMAAGVLVVQESGGSVTDLDGAPWTAQTEHVVAANTTLHPGLLALLAEAR